LLPLLPPCQECRAEKNSCYRADHGPHDGSEEGDVDTRHAAEPRTDADADQGEHGTERRHPLVLLLG
jgi:hypothetical protein